MFVHDWAVEESTVASNSCSSYLPCLSTVCFWDNGTDVQAHRQAEPHLPVSHTCTTDISLNVTNIMSAWLQFTVFSIDLKTQGRFLYLPQALSPGCQWCCPELSHSQIYSRRLWNNSVNDRRAEREARGKRKGEEEIGKWVDGKGTFKIHTV